MKYTRYDLNMRKRKNERKKMLVAVLGVVVVAVLVGTLLWKFVLQPNMTDEEQKTNIVSNGEQANTEGTDTENANTNNTNNEQATTEQPTTNATENETKPVSTNTGGTQEYVMVQCGFYAKKESADSIINQLQSKTIAVTITEKDQATSEDRYRVIAYIGSEDEAQKLVDEFTTADISNAKARFSIPKTDLTNSEIAEIINGYLKIIEKLKDSEVKSVKTQEFKDWTNALEEDTSAQNYALFKELKDVVLNLPEEVSKDNIGNGYEVVYKVLNNFRVNN